MLAESTGVGRWPESKAQMSHVVVYAGRWVLNTHRGTFHLRSHGDIGSETTMRVQLQPRATQHAARAEQRAAGEADASVLHDRAFGRTREVCGARGVVEGHV